MCETACTELGLSAGTLKDNNACYKAGNGKCRQDGRQGSKVNLVCMSDGNESLLIGSSIIDVPVVLPNAYFFFCLFNGYDFLNIHFHISNNYYHHYNLNYDDDINYVYHNNNYNNNNNHDFEGLRLNNMDN